MDNGCDDGHSVQRYLVLLPEGSENALAEVAHAPMPQNSDYYREYVTNSTVTPGEFVVSMPAMRTPHHGVKWKMFEASLAGSSDTQHPAWMTGIPAPTDVVEGPTYMMRRFVDILLEDRRVMVETRSSLIDLLRFSNYFVDWE